VSIFNEKNSASRPKAGARWCRQFFELNILIGKGPDRPRLRVLRVAACGGEQSEPPPPEGCGSRGSKSRILSRQIFATNILSKPAELSFAANIRARPAPPQAGVRVARGNPIYLPYTFHIAGACGSKPAGHAMSGPPLAEASARAVPKEPHLVAKYCGDYFYCKSAGTACVEYTPKAGR